MPTNTWQAYNFRDADGNGWGDTWYAKGAQSTASSAGCSSAAACRRSGGSTTSASSAGCMDGQAAGDHHRDRPRVDPDRRGAVALYDFVIFPGHTEYVTRHEYDLIESYRNLGGNLAFLSANNFFWEVRSEGAFSGGRGTGATSAGRSRR